MHPNETRIFLAILTGVLVIIFLIAVFIISAIYHQKQNAQLKLAQLSVQLKALERERARIAADLHDDLGSSLAAIRLQIKHLKTNNQNDTTIIEEAKSYIDEAIQKLSYVSFNMMPLILQRNGLSDAIKELSEMIEITTAIKIKCDCTVDIKDNDRRIHLYRIIQEVLNNIVKHSKATAVNISVRKNEKYILVDIIDNGIGFDKDRALKSSTGRGLKNIKSRVEILRGKSYLSTRINRGVHYSFEIPDTEHNG